MWFYKEQILEHSCVCLFSAKSRVHIHAMDSKGCSHYLEIKFSLSEFLWDLPIKEQLYALNSLIDNVKTMTSFKFVVMHDVRNT